MRLLLISLLFIVISASISGQSREAYDFVETMVGDRYTGKITHYEYGKILTIRLLSGQEITLSNEEIRRMRHGKGVRPGSMKKEQVFVEDWKDQIVHKEIENRFRPSVFLTIHGGKRAEPQNRFFFDETRILGYSAEVGMNYRLIDWLDVGAGVSYDRFNSNRGESVVAYLATVQLLPYAAKKTAPYARLSVGYGRPVKTDRNPFTDAEGGILLHPGIGLRIGKTNEAFYTLDLGYRFLNTAYEVFTFNGNELRNNTYRRLSLRLGATF